jgi:hypothetical protein
MPTGGQSKVGGISAGFCFSFQALKLILRGLIAGGDDLPRLVFALYLGRYGLTSKGK